MKIRKLPVLFIISFLAGSCGYLSRHSPGPIHDYEMNKPGTPTPGKNADTFSSKAVSKEHDWSQAIMLTGDVSGNDMPEIIFVKKDTIHIENTRGVIIREQTMAGENFGSALLADIDGDGKKDILLGSSQGKGVRISGYSGVLEKLFDFSYSHMFNGNTRVHFFHDGTVYFTGSSSLGIPPKIAGAYHIERNEIVWEYFTGPIPLDLAADKEFTLLTLSNYPGSANGLVPEDEALSDHSQFKSSLYLFTSGGEKRLQKSLGPDHYAGQFIDGDISSVKNRLVDMNGDNKPELLTAINRISDFSRGPSELVSHDLEGNLLNRQSFGNNTELDFAWYNRGRNREIIIMETLRGEVHLLNEDLDILRSWKAPSPVGEGQIHQCIDMNGDGKTEFLISVEKAFFILDQRLNVIYSREFDSAIIKAEIIIVQEKPLLLIQSHTLEFLEPAESPDCSLTLFTHPPGGDIFLDGKAAIVRAGVMVGLSGGTHTVQASLGDLKSEVMEITLREGIHQWVDLTIESYSPVPMRSGQQALIVPRLPPEIPLDKMGDLVMKGSYPLGEGEIFLKAADLLRGSEKELLFIEGNTFKIYDLSMNLLSEFTQSGVNRYLGVQTLLAERARTKDSLFFISQVPDRQVLYTYGGDGKMTGYKRIGSYPDARVGSVNTYLENFCYLEVVTGYGLQPRGIAGINMAEQKIESFAPMAAAPGGSFINQGVLYPGQHTLSNGGTVSYDLGETASDEEYFLYRFDLDGKILPGSRNPLFQENNGVITLFGYDEDKNGENEVYFITNKTNYYTGTPALYRFEGTRGEYSRPLFSFAPGQQVSPVGEMIIEGESHLVFTQRNPYKLFILNRDFSLHRTLDWKDLGYEYSAFVDLIDLDGDGDTEIILRDANRVRIYGNDFTLLHVIIPKGKGEIIRNGNWEDYNSDGKEELLLVTDRAVSFYSY